MYGLPCLMINAIWKSFCFCSLPQCQLDTARETSYYCIVNFTLRFDGVARCNFFHISCDTGAQPLFLLYNFIVERKFFMASHFLFGVRTEETLHYPVWVLSERFFICWNLGRRCSLFLAHTYKEIQLGQQGKPIGWIHFWSLSILKRACFVSYKVRDVGSGPVTLISKPRRHKNTRF